MGQEMKIARILGEYMPDGCAVIYTVGKDAVSINLAEAHGQSWLRVVTTKGVVVDCNINAISEIEYFPPETTPCST